MVIYNFSNIRDFLKLGEFKGRKIVAGIIILIGFLQFILPLIILFPYSDLDSIIKVVFISGYGLVELVNGIMGIFIEFKTDYLKISLISRYIIVVLIFIPYICIIASLVINSPILLTFRANALLLSLISLIDLFSIPILKYQYEKEN